MSSNGSDSCSNGSIPTQRDAIARQLVEAVTQCQDAPAVARQQAETQSEVEALEALLGPFVSLVRYWRECLEYDDVYGGEGYREDKANLEQPIEYGAALAKETGNRALAKVARQVRGALVAIGQVSQHGREYQKVKRVINETEKDLLNRPLERYKQAVRDAEPLVSKAEDRLRQLCTQAHVRRDRLQARAAEIDGCKKRQTELQAAAHALAAIHRVPDAPEDEGDNGR